MIAIQVVELETIPTSKLKRAGEAAIVEAPLTENALPQRIITLPGSGVTESGSATNVAGNGQGKRDGHELPPITAGP